MPEFLPISRADMQRRGWEQCDFVYIIGDGYVDHPSFGHAIISRVLEDAGYKIGIISQPDWKKPDSINVLGEPRLGFLVMGGNMDSMVNHYTVSKAHRKQDAYTPGGVMGKRPDYAVTVYCNLIRRTYRRKPIIIGGIEASLRRLAHYDYWSDKLKRSILLDSQADLLIYGMGERAVIEIANALNDGMDAQDITYIDGTVYKTREPDTSVPSIMLPAFPDMQKNPRVYAESFSVQYRNTDPFCAKRLIEPYGEHEFIVQNPPQKPLSQKEMDHVYDLPYCRTFHPSYKKLGGIPAIAEIEFSLTSCRGCFGACSFCALTFHQGRIIQTRSQESIIKEAEGMTHTPGFKGYIHDVGGPTANFRQPACKKQLQRGACPTRQCLFPSPCKNLIADHTDYLSLLRKLRKLPGVKKVFIRSGIRFDYLLADPSDTFFKELVRDGQSLNAMWNRRQCTKFNGASYIIQRGAAAIYTEEGERQIEETLAYYRNNARVIKEGLEAAGFTVYGAVNSPYIWCKTPEGVGSWEFFDKLLTEANIITTPGAGFGPSGEGYVRLTAFGDADATVEAMERIQKLMAK